MRRLIVPALVASMLVACGGGGGGGSAVPAAGGGMHSTGQATVSVLIPNAPYAAPSAHRAPQLISAATVALQFSVIRVDGASPSPAIPPLVITIATSPDCSKVSGGTSCSVSVPVPIATSVVIQIATLDANGNVLGVGDVGPIDTTQANIPAQSVSLGGVPASLTLSPSAVSAPDDGATHTITLTVSAKDSSGNTILPPGSYGVPITLALVNASGTALSLSPATIASPGPNGDTTVTLTYNAAQPAGLTQITASSGSATQSATFAPLVFTPTTFGQLYTGAPVTVTVSEAGYGGAFTITAPSFVSTTCAPASCAPASPGGAVAITMNATSAGNGNLAIADTHGAAASIALSATTISGGGSVVGPQYHVYEYPTATGGRNYGITVGSSGQSLWYVDSALATIGTIASPGACNGTILSCPIKELTPFSSLSPQPSVMQAISTGFDGNLYIADPGNLGSDPGSVEQISCADATSSCATPLQMGFASASIATPAPADVELAPNGYVFATSSFQTILPGPPPTPGPSAIYAVAKNAFASGVPIEMHVAMTQSSPAYMTLDSTGSIMWFTDAGNGNIGFFPMTCGVTSTCTISEEPSEIVTPNSFGSAPRGGPQIAPHPLVSPSPPPGTPFSTPLEGIVEGPDGYLYVAEPSANRIDRLNAAAWQSCQGINCTFTPISLPRAGARPMMLTVGPDGNVWFTDANPTSGAVGFIALSSCTATGCAAYEYPVPTANGMPWGITSGPDGNIWFTESGTNAIGEVKLQ